MKVWPGMNQMISDYNSLEQNLRDLRTVLACICMQQDDKTFSVPFSELRKVPSDIQLEVSVDNVHWNYVFKLFDKNGNQLGLHIFADAPAAPVEGDVPPDHAIGD